MYDNASPSPKRRMASIAVAALVCLNLAALAALGLAVERGRAELAAVSDRLAALSLADETATRDDPARLAEALAALDRKIDALAAASGQDAKTAAALRPQRGEDGGGQIVPRVGNAQQHIARCRREGRGRPR
ncbi:MAG TPA: hypothetical protein PKC79_08630, partial [Solidesulfovibrio magneticus]|nr:hypothetical protein [Solidesulfovibrio magneticus]